MGNTGIMLVCMPPKRDIEGFEEAVRRIDRAKTSGAGSIDLSALNLSTIPDSVAQLQNLQKLYLGNNQISTIPDSLTQLSKLQALDLSNNQISTIPNSFLRLSELTRLYLDGNSQLGIPEEILGSYDKPRPAQETLRYYFAQSEASKPLNEATLILVGTGGVRKTSLVKTQSTV